MVRYREDCFNAFFFHDNMAGSLAIYMPIRLLEDFYCFSARAVAWEFWHLYCDLAEDMIFVTPFIAFSSFIKNLKAALHSVLYIFESILFSVSLRNTAGNCRAFSNKTTYFTRFDYNFIFHSLLPPFGSIAYWEVGVKKLRRMGQTKVCGYNS